MLHLLRQYWDCTLYANNRLHRHHTRSHQRHSALDTRVPAVTLTKSIYKYKRYNGQIVYPSTFGTSEYRTTTGQRTSRSPQNDRPLYNITCPALCLYFVYMIGSSDQWSGPHLRCPALVSEPRMQAPHQVVEVAPGLLTKRGCPQPRPEYPVSYWESKCFVHFSTWSVTSPRMDLVPISVNHCHNHLLDPFLSLLLTSQRPYLMFHGITQIILDVIMESPLAL